MDRRRLAMLADMVPIHGGDPNWGLLVYFGVAGAALRTSSEIVSAPHAARGCGSKPKESGVRRRSPVFAARVSIVAAYSTPVSTQKTQRFDTIVLQHPSLLGRVRGNWQAQYVSMADLERTAAEQSSWRFRSDNRRKVIFLRKCRDHFSSACPVLIDEQHDPAVEFPWAYAFSDDKD